MHTNTTQPAPVAWIQKSSTATSPRCTATLQTRRTATSTSPPAVRSPKRSVTSHEYGARSVSMLALKPLAASRHTSDPYSGGGARVADATREEGFTNTTITQEVSK